MVIERCHFRQCPCPAEEATDFMSQSQTTPITCRQCGAQHEFTIWSSLNVTLDPGRKEPLLKGTLTRFTCPDCQWNTEVVYPLLYHDMEQRVMIYLWPGKEAVEMDLSEFSFLGGLESYRCRHVVTRNELLEKVYLFDSGLDDRVVEVLKATVRAKSADTLPPDAEIYFDGMTGEGAAQRQRFAVIFSSEMYTMEIPHDQYEGFANWLAPRLEAAAPANPWQRVNLDYARTLVMQP